MSGKASFTPKPRSWRLLDRPLAVQFLIAGGIVVVFSVISLSLLIYQIDREVRSTRFLAETHRTIALLNTLGRDFYRQRIELEQYSRTRLPLNLANFLERQRFWEESAGEIAKHLQDIPSQRDLLLKLNDSYRDWLEIAQRLIDARLRANPDSLREEESSFRDTFVLIDRLVTAQNKMLTHREEEEKSSLQKDFIARAASNILLLVVFGIVLGRLYTAIARPVAQLSRGIRRYENGDFGTRVPVSSKSEIGHLQASFNELAEKIEAMVTDLRKLDELKTDFLSTVSHELRTPLTSIGGYVKLLATGDAGTVNETQKEFLYIIDTNVVRLTNLINDILDVEKLESGKVQLEKSPIDIGGILKEVRDTFALTAKNKGLELRFEISPRLAQVLGDRDRLIQVFLNLVSNAIKYTKKGYVEIRADVSDYAVVVRIHDTGVGLTREEQEKLFQKFYRARSGLTSGEGGTGLGLVIVRRLIEAHGGRIAVESIPEVGTTFIVTLPSTTPIVEVEGVEVAEVAEDTTRSWTRPVWLLEQDSEYADEIQTLIENEIPQFRGYRIQVARFTSVEDTPELHLSQEVPLVVIMDPRQYADLRSSLVLLRKRLHQTVPLLMLTEDLDPASAFAEGASAALVKPIDRAQFIAAMRDLIGSRSWRILLADRNTDLRLLLKRAFEQRGIKVDDVDRGNLVLSRLDQEHYDLALIDLGFPDIRGQELVRTIRRIERFRELPIFVTSEDEKSAPSNRELEAWGVTQFVPKYRGIGGVVDVVCQYLENRKQHEHHT